MAKKLPAKKASAKAGPVKKAGAGAGAPKAKAGAAPAKSGGGAPAKAKPVAKVAAKPAPKAAPAPKPAPAKPAPAKAAPKGAAAPAKDVKKAVGKGDAGESAKAAKAGAPAAPKTAGKKGASVTEAPAKGKPLVKKGASSGPAESSKKSAAAEPAAPSKGAAKPAGKAPAPGAKGAPAAPAGAKPAAAKPASSSKKSAGKNSVRSGDQTGTPGHAFLSEPGPRFRSPFSGSASTAKEAAAKMAELAGLTAIRAASVRQAPTLKKFKKITETPLPEKQLEEFREILEAKREQLVGDVSSMEKEALGGDGGSLSRLPQHMADQGTDTYDQSLNLDLAASQRGIVKEIDAALDRIVNRTFGVCELLGKPIGIDRLRNAPWTRYSIEAARMLELNPELARVGGGNGDSGDSGDDDDNDDDV